MLTSGAQKWWWNMAEKKCNNEITVTLYNCFWGPSNKWNCRIAKCSSVFHNLVKQLCNLRSRSNQGCTQEVWYPFLRHQWDGPSHPSVTAAGMGQYHFAIRERGRWRTSCPVKTVVWSMCFPKEPLKKLESTSTAIHRNVGQLFPELWDTLDSEFFTFAVFSSGVKSQWIVLVHIAGLLRDSESHQIWVKVRC